jgi:hypothetical protein
MPHFKCLACKTRRRSTENPADPIGDLCTVCGSLLEPVGDLGEIVGYRVIETRGSTSHRGASGAGRLIAGCVGEIIARREFKHARVRLEIERCDAGSVSPQFQAVSSRAPGKSDAVTRPRSHHSPRRRESGASSELSTKGAIGTNGAARRKLAFRPRPRFAWRTMNWDRRRATPRRRRHLQAWRPRKRDDRCVPGRQATHRHEPRLSDAG